MKRSVVIDRDGPEKNLDHDLIDVFFNKAVSYDSTLSRHHQIRCIGIDEETTGLILNFIKKKEKKIKLLMLKKCYQFSHKK